MFRAYSGALWHSVELVVKEECQREGSEHFFKVGM